MVKIYSAARHKIPKTTIIAAAETFLKKHDVPYHNLVNIVFVGKRKMREIASTYKNEDVALPVLAFSYKDKPVEENEEQAWGEVIICYPQAVLLAAERDRSVNQTLISLIEHGIMNIIKE